MTAIARHTESDKLIYFNVLSLLLSPVFGGLFSIFDLATLKNYISVVIYNFM